MIRWIGSLTSVRFMRYGAQAFPRLFWVCLVLIIFVQLLEGLGIGLFLPLLQLVGPESGQPTSQLGKLVFRFLQLLGLTPTLTTVLVFIITVFTLKAVLQFCSGLLSSWMAVVYLSRMREKLYDATLDARYAFLSDRKVGHFSNVMGNELYRASGGIISALTFYSEGLSIATYLLCAALIDWKITLGGMLLAGVAYLLLHRVVRAGRVQAQHRQDAENELLSLVYESLSSIRSIKGMSREQPFRTRMSALVTRTRKAEILRSLQSSFLSSGAEPVAVAAVCAILYFNARHSGSVTTAAFLVLVGLIYRTLRRLSVLPKYLHTLHSQLPSFEILDLWLTEALDSAETSADEAIETFERLEFEHVSFAYGEQDVIQGLDLSLARGEMIAVVGPSGAGKSTLVGLVMGLLRRYRGQLTVNGAHELRDLQPGRWRGRIGYVSQEIQLFNATVAENIAFLEDVPMQQIRAAAERANCHEFIERLEQGYDTPIGDRGTRLSGGQRQRLAMARALIGEPELLILDEATSDLDSESEARIQASIEALHGNITILAIAHRLSTIRDADRIYVIADGKKVEEGTYEALIAQGGQFARLYEKQIS